MICRTLAIRIIYFQFFFSAFMWICTVLSDVLVNSISFCRMAFLFYIWEQWLHLYLVCMCVCLLFLVAVFSIFSVNTIIIVCVSVCDAGDNIDQKKEKLYIIRTVFNYMRIVPVCERERNYTKKKHIKKKKCHHRLVSPLPPIFVHSRSWNFFLFVCIHQFFFCLLYLVWIFFYLFHYIHIYTPLVSSLRVLFFVYATCLCMSWFSLLNHVILCDQCSVFLVVDTCSFFFLEKLECCIFFFSIFILQH